jgi:transposase
MELFVGIDWAQDSHEICVLDTEATIKASFRIEHTYEGLKTLSNKLRELAQGDLTKIGCALETNRGLLVNTLLAEGFNIYPINPREVDNRRKTSGAKTDRIDAKILAKILRSDYQDLKKLEPDSETITELRQLTRDQNGLIQTHTSLIQQLRDCLKEYFPGLLEVFPELNSDTPLLFLKSFPTLEAAQRIDISLLAVFFKENRVPRPNETASRVYIELHKPQLQARPAIIRAKSRLALGLIEQILVLRKQIQDYDREIDRVFKSHSDSQIFASLNRAGKRLAPRLLAEWGDNRERFSSAKEVQALAGTSPTPYQSGKLSWPHYRWSCVKDFRYVMHLYAWQSTFSEPWALDYYQRKRSEGKKHHEAVRALSNIWVRIVFAMWQNHEPYNRETFLAAQINHQKQIA